MSLETVSSVDINFSNGGGEHSANITSFLDVKDADGHPSLGLVNGDIGSRNYFSNDEINNIMQTFDLHDHNGDGTVTISDILNAEQH